MSVPELGPTDMILTRDEHEAVRDYPHPDQRATRACVSRWARRPARPSCMWRCEPDLRRLAHGAGGVHHVAFRTPDDGLRCLDGAAGELRMPTSGKVERYWFRSLYFREPNGILFEIATDGPGFAVDEPLDSWARACCCRRSLKPSAARSRRG